MANSKDNLSKYGKAFIGFDEPSGNAMDSIGGYIGTLNNAPTRVTGWNGKGSAMSFNGTNQYVEFNNKIIPLGAKSVRFKIFVNSISASGTSTVISNGAWSLKKGFTISVTSNEGVNVYLFKGVQSAYVVHLSSPITMGEWHDILYTQTPNNLACLYIDGVLVDSKQLTDTEHIGDSNLFLGKPPLDNANYFSGLLDSLEIYDRVISPVPDKYLVQHNSDHKYHDGIDWQSTTPTEENFIKYGMNNLNHITEKQWKELLGDKSVIMWSDFVDKQFTSVVLNKNEFKAQDLLGDKPQVIYYTDSDTSLIAVETGVDPYSVYDYIGELPTVVAYTESTDDIIVSTTTEPFDIYEEFGDSVEVLYYTDDEAVKEADLILEANWSPIDELEGDFEVVTWTDEDPETAQRVLEMKAIPQPQFIKLLNPKRVYGSLDDVFV
ncbi:hypothetical protein B1B04_09100, partial [Lysinibacillus sp. KCTC 33748]|uniref:LamG domain-containing protein n=1 Tax=unclassified Lysinibacillus TaxID=2636778 RepID=UPI0009A8B1A2